MRQALTRAAIVAAAIDVIDSVGLAKLTMRRLASAVGVEPMSLYHHFPSKADLLDAIVDSAAASFASSAELSYHAGQASWPAGLTAFGNAMRAALLEHPRLIPLVSTRPTTPAAAESLGAGLLVALTGGGLSQREAEFAIQSVAVFVLGHVLAEAGQTPGAADIPNRSADQAYYDDWFTLGLTALVHGLSVRVAR